MVFKKYSANITLRVLFLTLTLLVLVWLVVVRAHVFSPVVVTLLAVLQVFLLIRFLNRTNRKLVNFFESIRHADFTASFSEKGMGESFEQLGNSMNQVIEALKKIRTDKEEQFNYLQAISQHISVGILCYRSDGKVDLYNNAFKKIFGIAGIRTIADLAAVDETLPEYIMGLKAGDKTLLKVFAGDEMKQVAIYATQLRMRGEDFILISLQDIHTELEEKEIESWQKLIRVLTHEIMNSITPISSLASTVSDMLIRKEDGINKMNELDADDVENVDSALAAIRSRSEGLLNFVDIYRNLTRIPKPNFRYFAIRDIFDHTENLLKNKFEEQKIAFYSRIIPEDLKLTADADLIEQVLINLLLNAIDAVGEKEAPEISLMAYTNQFNRVIIDVADNGTGIKPDIIDKIFMPFFTSKKDGNGIGLSLSRQIMYMHKGTVHVKSVPGEGSVFSLTF